MADALVEDDGRILIPDSVREELQLKPDQRLEARVEGSKLILSIAPLREPPIKIEETTEGVYPRDPESAKALWLSKSHPY